MKRKSRVWYACYGSNLRAARFRAYIEGTVNEANGIAEKGCRDRTLWTAEQVRTYSGRLYFARSSGKWDGGGVAFIDPEASGTIYMRLYLITEEQFSDIQEQEGAWYCRRVCLGFANDGNPVYTFTAGTKRPYNPPSERYRSVIEDALIHECGIPEETVKAYLSEALHR